MAAHKAKVIDTIRGKNLVSGATKDDVDKLLEHIDALEAMCDEAEKTDVFGTEGWRHYIGVE